MGYFYFLGQEFTDVDHVSIGSDTQRMLSSSITVKRNDANMDSLEALLEEYSDTHVSYSEGYDYDSYMFHHSKPHHFLLIIKK